MAAIDFPDSPTIGDIVVRGGFSWQWNGAVWKKILVAGTALPDGTNNLDLIKWNSSTEGWEADSQANVIGTFVGAAVSALVDSAPASLDTLNELAAALNDDENFATTVTTALSGKANTSHTHAISDVTNLQTSLDAKTSTGKAIAMAIVF
jgi:hypothetical protein